MPPDYWPDARRIPKDKLKAFVDAVRATRKAEGLKNAELCREVRDLIHAHNAVPGRARVHVKAISEDWEYDEQGKYELGAIIKGTRKYIVGYLAWLCLRNEAAARNVYREAGLPFRPYRDNGPALGSPATDPKSAGTHDHDEAFEEASGKDQFLVYEIAFLWYGIIPPPAQVHESTMTSEIAEMKALLHTAIDLRKLSAVHLQTPYGGYARIVEREELRRFSQEIDVFPRFLFPDRDQPSDEMVAKLAELAVELDALLTQLPQPLTDWSEEYVRDEWAIYEAAFLWHGFAPPPMALHERAMPEPVRQTKEMLHDAANSNVLALVFDGGVRVRNVMISGTRYVSRFELRRFATSIGQRPRFLFPEDEE